MPADRRAEVARRPTSAPRPPGALGERAVADRRRAADRPARRIPSRPSGSRRSSRSGGSATPTAVPALAARRWPTPTAYLAFSARQALRRIGDWKATAAGLDSPDPKVRAGVLLALELVYDADAASALAEFAEPTRPARRRAGQGPAVPGRRSTARRRPGTASGGAPSPAQGKPPAKTVAWEGTPLVLGAIRDAPGRPGRPGPARGRRGREARRDDRDALPMLRERFAAEPDATVRRAIARALGALDDKAALPLLIAALRDPDGARAGPRRGAGGRRGDRRPTRRSQALVELLATSDLGRRAPAAGDRRARPVQGDARPCRRCVGALDEPDAGRPRRGGRGARQDRRRRGRAGAAPRRCSTDPTRRRPQGRDRRRSAALKDREAIPALLSRGRRPRPAFEATLALAAMPDVRALPGLPPRPDRQEPRPPQGVVDGRSPRSATRPRRSSTSSPRATSCPRRPCPSCGRSTPVQPDHRLARRRPVPDQRPSRRSRRPARST